MPPDPPTVPVPIKKRRFTLIFLYFTVLPVLEGIWWVSVDVFSLRPELKMYVLRGTFPSGHLRPDLRNLATRFSESLSPMKSSWRLMPKSSEKSTNFSRWKTQKKMRKPCSACRQRCAPEPWRFQVFTSSASVEFGIRCSPLMPWDISVAWHFLQTKQQFNGHFSDG